MKSVNVSLQGNLNESSEPPIRIKLFYYVFPRIANRLRETLMDITTRKWKEAALRDARFGGDAEKRVPIT